MIKKEGREKNSSWNILRKFSGIFSGGTEENQGKYQESRPPVLESNTRPLEYEGKLLTTTPRDVCSQHGMTSLEY
jgi:hypothetical protein